MCWCLLYVTFQFREHRHGAASLSREIAPKSPFVCVNRIPIQLFRHFCLSCATAIRCSVNIALVIKLSSENFQTLDVRSNVQFWNKKEWKVWFIFAKLSYKTWPGKSVIHPDLILLSWQSFILVLRLLVLSTLRVMRRMPMSTNAFVTSLAPRSKISYAQLKVSKHMTRVKNIPWYCTLNRRIRGLLFNSRGTK